jgi:hypothetical protein
MVVGVWGCLEVVFVNEEEEKRREGLTGMNQGSGLVDSSFLVPGSVQSHCLLGSTSSLISEASAVEGRIVSTVFQSSHANMEGSTM